MLVFTCYPTSGAVQILHTTYIKIEAKTLNVIDRFDRFGQAPLIRVNNLLNLLKISSEYYLPFELIKWMKSFLQMAKQWKAPANTWVYVVRLVGGSIPGCNQVID